MFKEIQSQEFADKLLKSHFVNNLANPRFQVTITVVDINDNTPIFIQDPLVIEVSSRRSQRVLATMKAEDKDFGANGSVFYRFAAPVKGFGINSLTGEIQATQPLDTLSQAQRTLIVEAMDQGTPAQSAQGVVVIYVKEVEYHGIRFSRNARDVSLQENAAKGPTSGGTHRDEDDDLISLSKIYPSSAPVNQVQLWPSLRPSIQMEIARGSATASSAETDSRPSESARLQVNTVSRTLQM